MNTDRKDYDPFLSVFILPIRVDRWSFLCLTRQAVYLAWLAMALIKRGQRTRDG